MLNPECISRAVHGDSRAFEELFLQTHDKAYSVAYHVLKDEYEAEDIVQDAYITMLEKVNTLEDTGRFESWFYRIVKNAALDQLRKRRPDPFANFQSDADPDFQFEDTIVSDYTPFDPEATVDYAELQNIMQGFIRELPETQRKCILLRFHEDMKIGDIARAMGIPESTVKSNLTYGKKKIETEVRALEKQGVKLYSLSPITAIAFLRWMWGNSVPAAVAAKASAGATAGAAAGTAAAGASAGSGSAASGAASVSKAGLSLTAKKIVAGACAAAVVTSAAVGVVLHNAETKLKDILRVEKQGLYSEYIDYGYCVPQFNSNAEGYQALNRAIMENYERWEELRAFYGETPEQQEYVKKSLLRGTDGEPLCRYVEGDARYENIDYNSSGLFPEELGFTVAVRKIGPFISVFCDSDLYYLSSYWDSEVPEVPPETEMPNTAGLYHIEDGTPASWEDVASECGVTLVELAEHFRYTYSKALDVLGVPELDSSTFQQEIDWLFAEDSAFWDSTPAFLPVTDGTFRIDHQLLQPSNSLVATMMLNQPISMPGKGLGACELALFTYQGAEFLD